MADNSKDVEDFRIEILLAVQKHGYTAEVSEANRIGEAQVVYVNEARTFDQLIVAIREVKNAERFNVRLRNELDTIEQLINVRRHRS